MISFKFGTLYPLRSQITRMAKQWSVVDDKGHELCTSTSCIWHGRLCELWASRRSHSPALNLQMIPRVTTGPCLVNLRAKHLIFSRLSHVQFYSSTNGPFGPNIMVKLPLHGEVVVV